MNGITVLWAQALDNTSADHIRFCGEYLSEEDDENRQKAVSNYSKVIKTGSVAFDRGGVRLTENGRRFVLEVHAVERDVIGRIAPIVFCGDCSENVGNDFEFMIWNSISDFARQINRTIKPGHQELARESLESLKKNMAVRRKIKQIYIGLIGSILLVAMVWLLAKI